MPGTGTVTTRMDTMTEHKWVVYNQFTENMAQCLTICSSECFIPKQSLCDLSNLRARIAQLVEHMTENPGVGGSSPPPGTILQPQADVAQSVEQLTRNEQVCGSTPHVGSNFNEYPIFIYEYLFTRKVLLCH
jgi:hypothetical protein